ncbi:MAG: YdeI/OmpD-associated family protein [Chitinophagaceae bacterium]|nr:YdeI/OmpD-associated family protein [Chitinophagaceae bacterium]
MAIKEEKIDAYIARSAEFAKPILLHIRELVHKACPDVEEKMKWSMPFFDYKGEMLCHMASFKQHAVMGFWKASLMKDSTLVENAKSETAMGHLGKITSLKDLPSDKKITGWIKEAMQLTDKGIKLPAKPKPAAIKELTVPDYFTKALTKNKKAKQVFEKFPPSHKKEYLMWITDAKTEQTRNKRMASALEWIADGKGRNWKYEKK